MKIFVLVAFLFVAPANAQELLLKGGRNQEFFLGCLNCGPYDSASICNRYGDYGSRYSDKSIWNQYGTYGSEYNDQSPWNRYASTAPAVVDRSGGFYGYFSANRYHRNRTQIPVLSALADNVDAVVEDLEKARDLFCDDQGT